MEENRFIRLKFKLYSTREKPLFYRNFMFILYAIKIEGKTEINKQTILTLSSPPSPAPPSGR